MDSSRLPEGPSSTPEVVEEEAVDDFEVISVESPMDPTLPVPPSNSVSSNEEEAMDTTPTVPPPSPQAPSSSSFASKKSNLKDFSLSSSSLSCDVSEADLKVAFKTFYASEQKAKAKAAAAGDFEIVESPDAPKQPTKKQSKAEHPFVSAMKKESQKTVTENNAPTFSTSDDARLDFFFGILEQSKKDRTIDLLNDSWKSNPLDTLKLLANLRDIREGKGIRVQYQQCLYWLYQNHPKTLYENLEQLVAFGYWKDVLHLLVIILFDGYMHPYFNKDACPKSNKRTHVKPSKCQIQKHTKRLREKNLEEAKKLVPVISENLYSRRSKKFQLFSQANILKAKVSRKAVDDENRVYNKRIAEHYKVTKEVSKIPGKEMTRMRLQYARDKLMDDAKYRVFHGKVAQIFATQLISDVNEMKRKKTDAESKAKDKKEVIMEVSLAAKWAPSLEAHFDKYTLIASAIGLEIVKQLGGSHLDILTKSIPVATYLARKLYHKEYCVPLRRFLDIPEHYISAKEFQKVNYKRVAAKSMKKNKETFIKHDRDRFLEYLLDSKSKVAGASLKPVELICEAMEMDRLSKSSDEDLIKKLILEKQWTSLTESVKKNGGGKLRNAVAICDVSGSMSGIPMQAAIGLTLLTMSASEEPWNSMCITFSASPEVFHLDTSLGLSEKLQKMKAMKWGMNTDLHKAFQLIVNLGKKNELRDDQMPKILFVFTDMEFDEACSGTNETNFEAAKKLFKGAGYSMPEIVFWNLRESCRSGIGTSTPVQKNELGVSLLSGFSGQMLSFIISQDDSEEAVEMEEEEEKQEEESESKGAIQKVVADKPKKPEMTPLNVMLGIIANEKYKSLIVYD